MGTLKLNTTKIFSRAPTRIDLAGGTLDIWPLYLFLKDPLTINLGIDLFAEAALEETPAGQARGSVTLRAEDQKAELRFGWDELATIQVPPALELHLKFLRHFTPDHRSFETDFLLSTRARSPAGAGLGGSSSLSIAMIGALATWASHWKDGHLTGSVALDVSRDGVKYIDIVRDVETTVIRVPAGLQDYYGAMYGGLQALHWQPGSHSREALPQPILFELEKRLMLFYSGQSRNSGINNWALFKNFLDRDAEVQSKFARINGATQKLHEAFLSQNWSDGAAAIAEEWAVRKTLAPGITTSEIDQAFEIATKDFPQVTGKICGAGGGGCFFFYFPDPIGETERTALAEKLQAIGIRHLPFRATPKGLEIRA